jgi:chromosome segregation ATPase
LWEELANQHQEHIALLQQKIDLFAQTSVPASEAQQKLNAVQSSMDNLQDQVALLKKEVAAKTAEREDMYRLLDRFKAQIQHASAVTDDQMKDAASLHERKDQLEEQLRRAQDNLQAKQLEIESLHQTIDQLKQDVTQAQEQARAKDLSLSLVQAKLDEKLKTQDSTVSDLNDQLKATAVELTQVKEKLSVAEAKLKEENQNDELAHVQDMLKSSREEIVQLNNLLQKKEDQIAQLQKAGVAAVQVSSPNQEKDIQNLRNELNKQKSQAQQLSEDLTWKDKEIARLKFQLKGQKIVPGTENATIADLQKQLKKSQEALQEAQMKDSYTQLRQALRDAKEQAATLKDKLRQKQAATFSKDPLYGQMADQIKTLKESIVELIKSEGDLKHRSDDLSTQLEETHAALAACQEQLKTVKTPALEQHPSEE